MASSSGISPQGQSSDVILRHRFKAVRNRVEFNACEMRSAAGVCRHVEAAKRHWAAQSWVIFLKNAGFLDADPRQIPSEVKDVAVYEQVAHLSRGDLASAS